MLAAAQPHAAGCSCGAAACVVAAAPVSPGCGCASHCWPLQRAAAPSCHENDHPHDDAEHCDPGAQPFACTNPNRDCSSSEWILSCMNQSMPHFALQHLAARRTAHLCAPPSRTGLGTCMARAQQRRLTKVDCQWLLTSPRRGARHSMVHRTEICKEACAAASGQCPPCFDGQDARRPRLDVGAGADRQEHHDQEGVEVEQRRHAVCCSVPPMHDIYSASSASSQHC